MFCKKTAQDVIHEWVHDCDEGAKPHLPTAEAFQVIWIVAAEKCSSLTQNMIQICCSAGSVILNVMATQHTCSLNGVYHPHWLVQWSCRCSLVLIPVHSPWLPGYINVVQTILVILTMAGLFLDRPHIPLLHTNVTVVSLHLWYDFTNVHPHRL